MAIPAYRPGPALAVLVRQLVEFHPVVVVDDGSGEAYGAVFADLRGATVLRHSVNRGKGAALKTAFQHLREQGGVDGVVTADADGQHRVEDIREVAAALERERDALILGARGFDGRVPLRSRIGNGLTRTVMRFVLGRRLRDTQTGLRGIPAELLEELVRLPSNGYEYELDMLVAAKHHRTRVVEVGIATIYEEGNPSSHFNPLFDSLKIYFVLLRFSFISLLTALVDNAVFYAAWRSTGDVLQSQVTGRAVAIAFNYLAARRAVFLSREPHTSTLPRYLLLVLLSGTVSYALIRSLEPATGVVAGKLLAETTLFLVNFLVQRDVVFTKRGRATDWDEYYRRTPPTARLTRKHTERQLIAMLGRCGEAREMVEFGGANSCFAEAVMKAVRPRRYMAVDTNEYGLSLLPARVPGAEARRGDVLAGDPAVRADVVFSVGLIEHFDPAGTRRAVHTHFDAAREHVLLSFPTPTWLYRLARGMAEGAGVWKFPDERPLEREEVLQAVGERGELMAERLLWPLVFTQRMMLFRVTRPQSDRGR
ncbi:MAG: bifunctional glycosyltransferase family 2/GtrA family protein [Bryobacteraceae bacterium]|nr:bifunctional glycosyltransferase family 2/GtrA family protein [Bryobacteraceae bacterium]